MAGRQRVGQLAVDANGTIESMDSAARRLLGDVEGEPVAAILGDGQRWIGPSEGLEARTADGGRIPVAVAIRPGKRGGLRVEVQGARAMERLEKRIRRSEAQLREAQEIAHIGSWSWDIPGDQITWSDELYRIYGLEPQSFQATFDAYMERIHPDDKELAQQVVEEALQGLAPFSFDHRIIRADGEVRWLHGQGAVEVVGGRPVRMYGVSQDITQQHRADAMARKALEKELEADHYKSLDEERSRLLNTMAHELNTPITPLQLQVKMLQEGILGSLNERQQHGVRIVARNVRRLAVLLQDILDVARLQSDHIALRRQETDVRGLVDDAVATFSPQAEDEGITVEVDGLDGASVDVDPDRLTQVLHNLLSNALKFTPEGGHVKVGLRADDGLVLEVTDTGAGLTPEQQEQLFRPFARVHEDQGQPGTGLGLHICKGIVEEHGGSISSHSDGPGRGSTFSVHLPGKVRVVATEKHRGGAPSVPG